MATTLSLIELRKKIGRLEIFVGKLIRNDPFITKTGKPYYANSVQILSSNGKEVANYSPRSLIEANKVIQYLRIGASSGSKILIYDYSNPEIKTPLEQFRITGEFGFRGDGYRDSMDTNTVRQCRVSLAKAIVQNKGPITLSIGTRKYYDICDVISSTSGGMSDVEFIDRYGNSVVWVRSTELTDDQVKMNSIRLYQESQTMQRFIKDLREAYPNGLESGVNLDRKFGNTSDGTQSKLKSIFGFMYERSSRYNQNNVTVVCSGGINIVRGTTGSYRLSSVGLKENGELTYGTSEPVMMALYSPGDSDFGLNNTKIIVDKIGNRSTKEF